MLFIDVARRPRAALAAMALAVGTADVVVDETRVSADEQQHACDGKVCVDKEHGRAHEQHTMRRPVLRRRKRSAQHDQRAQDREEDCAPEHFQHGRRDACEKNVCALEEARSEHFETYREAQKVLHSSALVQTL